MKIKKCNFRSFNRFDVSFTQHVAINLGKDHTTFKADRTTQTRVLGVFLTSNFQIELQLLPPNKIVCFGN